MPPRTFDSGCIDCGTPFHRPATLFGNTAEWMTEATFYSSDNPKWPNTLDDFGNVEMTRVDAVDQDGVDLRSNAAARCDPERRLDDVEWCAASEQQGTLLGVRDDRWAREGDVRARALRDRYAGRAGQARTEAETLPLDLSSCDDPVGDDVLRAGAGDRQFAVACRVGAKRRELRAPGRDHAVYLNRLTARASSRRGYRRSRIFRLRR